MGVRSLPSVCGLTAIWMLTACAPHGGQAGPTSPVSQPHAAVVKAATAPVAPPPATQGSRTEKWIDLQVGDCVADLPPADLSRVTVTVVDCATAHLAEVYLRAPMAVDTPTSRTGTAPPDLLPTPGSRSAGRCRSRISSTPTKIEPAPIPPPAR
jgi:hypothetical protein